MTDTLTPCPIHGDGCPLILDDTASGKLLHLPEPRSPIVLKVDDLVESSTLTTSRPRIYRLVRYHREGYFVACLPSDPRHEVVVRDSWVTRVWREVPR